MKTICSSVEKNHSGKCGSWICNTCKRLSPKCGLHSFVHLYLEYSYEFVGYESDGSITYRILYAAPPVICVDCYKDIQRQLNELKLGGPVYSGKA